MKIQLLHNKDCHTWNKLLPEVKELFQELGIEIEPEVIVLGSDEEAAKWRFFGSPQLVVDGKDIDPMAEKMSNFHVDGCRMYIWQGKAYEWPPKPMVKEALIKVKPQASSTK